MDLPRITTRIHRLLQSVPLIDGHNDLPHAVRMHTGTPPDPSAYPLERDAPGHTDLLRLRRGRVSGQFWAAYVPPEAVGPGAAAWALEQLDVLRRIEGAYADDLVRCWGVAEVERAFRTRRIASLTGVEGGHALEGSLGVLRCLHRLGARYLTLTHNVTHDWADSATDAPKHGGLTTFGRDVVRELNRLGMLVDLSHASDDTARDAMEVSRAPVLYTHASARALTDHPRNVPDDLLEAVARQDGVVMVTFVARFVSEAVRAHQAAGGEPGTGPRATVHDVADHVEHVRQVAGGDHVGIGGDLDGTDELPVGLEDAAGYPTLFQVLADRGWSDQALAALAGGNILRVMRDAERTALEEDQAR